jgi:hypothetical protein
MARKGFDSLEIVTTPEISQTGRGLGTSLEKIGSASRGSLPYILSSSRATSLSEVSEHQDLKIGDISY